MFVGSTVRKRGYVVLLETEQLRTADRAPTADRVRGDEVDSIKYS